MLPKFGEGEEYELRAADHRVYSDPKVIGWRAERLLSAGFTAEETAVLSVNADIDVHKAVELRRKTEFAFEILK